MRPLLSFGLMILGLIFQGSTAGAQATPGGPFRYPVADIGAWRMTAAFDLDRSTSTRADWTGWRSGDPTAGSGHAYDNHSGTDWGMPNGTPLYAVESGTVHSFVEGVPNNDTSGTGNYIILNHYNVEGGRRFRTNYWHLAYNSVRPPFVGTAVAKGERIADSNNTGNSTGPHLHFGATYLDGSGLWTCPFYNGYWEEDEFYSVDGRPCLIYVQVNVSGVLNCREGTSTAYPVITTLPNQAMYVSSQHNGWYRIFLPMPSAFALENRTSTGALSPVESYTETGNWLSSSSKSMISEHPNDIDRVTLEGMGSRYSDASVPQNDTATFIPSIPQRGEYEVFVTWPSDANARNVSYTIHHLDGSSTVTLDQRGGFEADGNGTKASPYIINRNPYVVHHTTVGAPSEWNEYSPTGAGIPEYGPENLYRLTLRSTSTVTIWVEHEGYPDKDVDIHLLTAPSNTACIARADWSLTRTGLAAGTYYISIDTYGTQVTAPARVTDYTLIVTVSGDTFPDGWNSLGTYRFPFGRNPSSGSVVLSEASVTGAVTAGQPVRVYADAVKFVPKITHRSGWASNDFISRVYSKPCQVGVLVDQTAGNDSREISEYVEIPIHASAGNGAVNTSPVVGKAVTGQRFVAIERQGDWYQIFLTNGQQQLYGWVYGDHLFVYNDLTSTVSGWQVY